MVNSGALAGATGARELPSRAESISEDLARTGSDRERNLDYRGVFTVPGDGRRVVGSSDALQWSLQRRKGDRSGRRADWRGVGYFLTCDALMTATATHAAPCAASAPAIIANLPQFHPGSALHA